MDDTLTADPPGDAPGPAARGPALVVAWSLEEPHREGERVLVPDGARVVLGRGDAQPDDPAPRAWPVRLRPGRTDVLGPLEGRTLSKVQAVIERRGDRLRVVNHGRAALRVGPRAVPEAEVRAGDVIAFDGRLVLICVESPPSFPALPDVPVHPFGEPDALGLVGESEAMWALRRQLHFVGPRAAHVLIRGPSGSGKELVARALHALSPRRAGPWVDRNAATMPEGLVDAELFGHARNYPNPGTQERPGLIGEADGGTLFLDELGELPQAVQAHLLRVLDEGRYQRLGESRTRTADLRLVAATNRPVEALKHDLHARFKLTVEVPGLADRPEDLPLLGRHLLGRILASDDGLRARFPAPRLSQAFVSAALRHPWRTHARELDAWIWRALSASDDGWLEPAAPTAAPEPAPGPVDWRRHVGEDPATLPPEVVLACLEEHNGHQDLTWKALGLGSRYVLRRLLDRHGLSVTKRR